MRDFSIDLVWAKLQMAFSVIGGWLGYFVGGVDGLMTALLIFMILDYVTGLMCAVADKKLSSSVGFKGICKKVLIVMLVGVAHVVDMYVVGSGNALRSAVVCFYLSNEGVSMLENAAHLGLPIPEKLKGILAQLHNRDEKTETTKGEGGKVNIRVGHGTSYSRITSVAPGTTFEYVATAANGWHAVIVGAKVGFVAARRWACNGATLISTRIWYTSSATSISAAPRPVTAI